MERSFDKKAYFRLAQLERAVNQCNIAVIEKLLEKQVDINYALPVDSPIRNLKPHLIGNTALHFATHNNDQFLYLLNRGADFTKKNKDGKTVLHMLVQHRNIKEPLDNTLINSVLLAHVTTNNFSNPCNKDGLSHFHIACMTKNANVVQFFLDNGVPIDDIVSVDSKFSPGCSSLHFAAMSTNTKVVEILLACGVNMHITDASGKTALHVLIECRMQMFDSMGFSMTRKEDFYQKLQGQIQENDKIINMLLENMSSDNDGLDSIGLSNFHIACMLQDTSLAEYLVDQVIDLNHNVHQNSRLWPGYTALHFAAHFNISTVEMLIKQGANIESKDSKGVTPFDICIERYSIENICSIISLNAKWKDILFSDGKTKLVSLISALADYECFKKFVKDSVKDLNMRIPMNSPLWPGCSPLHLAVLFSERPKLIFGECRKEQREIDQQIMRFCLSQGADVSIQDIRGCTPLHLAFRLNKMTVVDFLFCHNHLIDNKCDNDGLSHLHIICAANNKKFKLKKLILNSSEVNVAYKGTLPVNNVKPGWTPLHVYLTDSKIRDDSNNIMKALLKLGVNPCIKDAYGLTAIHWLLDSCFTPDYRYITKKLLKQVPNDCVAEEYGLSHLHVACQLENHAAAKCFLNNGADVNLAIKYTKKNDNDPLSFIARYDKCTPLHISAINFVDMEELLLNYGADVFAKKANGKIPLDSSLVVSNFITRLWKNNELQTRLRREFGWTKLHLTCRDSKNLQVDDFQAITEAESADINAKIFVNSPFWKGYTPLHMLMYRGKSFYNAVKDVYPLSKILLENGADVTVIDDQGNSPIGMLFPYFDKYHEMREQAALLMKYHTNFTVNPVNDFGISHFHVACYVNDVDAVRGFLRHGVDVNEKIGLFSYIDPGYTPLHLATKLQVVELLISNGADIHGEDANGSTVIHEAVKRDDFDEGVIVKLIESGAEINSPNFYGKTPFETAISNGEMTVEKLKFFIDHGFQVNSCNPVTGIGYLSEIHHKDKNIENQMLEMVMNEKPTDILGRTTLHHLVTSSFSLIIYISLFEKLIKAGHDIDEQDSEGKTALHLAVKFENGNALQGLLTCGADINVLDKTGNSMLSYAYSRSKPSRPESESVRDQLAIHAIRLAFLKIDLNEIDVDHLYRAARCKHDFAINRSGFLRQVAITKEIELGVRSMRLYDFLSETGAVMIYPLLILSERYRIDQYFETLNADVRLKDIRKFLKLQYRKAVKRLELFDTAVNSIRLLLNFDLPDLCAENLFTYLRNSDLKNIIQAAIEREDVQMDAD